MTEVLPSTVAGRRFVFNIGKLLLLEIGQLRCTTVVRGWASSLHKVPASLAMSVARSLGSGGPEILGEISGKYKDNFKHLR